MVFCNALECSTLILLSVLHEVLFFFFNQAAVGLDFISRGSFMRVERGFRFRLSGQDPGSHDQYVGGPGQIS